MTRPSLKLAAMAAACAFLGASTALAQTPATAKPGSKRGKEFTIGGLVAGPTSVGSATAEELDGLGQPSVTLFRVDNKLGVGFGVESNIGVQLSKALWMEISGGWTRSNLNSEIRNDFENAFDQTISSSMSRFVLEGGIVRYFHDRGKSAWFIRMTGGWMLETAGGNTLTGDGGIANAGLGLRHWWRTNGKGSVKRVGLRVEGRATIRSGGISLGETGIRFCAAGAGHIVFGF
jgi:hypothetical protein